MRRIYCILCTGVLLLSSCQKLEFESPGNGDTNRLAFNASIDGMSLVPSRAVSDDTKLTATGFFLAGYHTVGLMDASAATAFPNIFDKQIDDQQLPVPLVEYKDNKFTLKTIKWALDNVSYLSFFGWSQSKPFASAIDVSTTGIIGQTFNSNDKGYPWIDIRNADEPTEQTDVVGARSLDQKNDAVISAIDLDFRHLLSKLSFKAKSSSKATITIQEVNIVYATNKVNKKVRYTFGSDPSSMGAYAFDGSEFHVGPQSLNEYNSVDIVAGAEVSLGSTMLIPQALQSGDVSIELKYQISPNSSAPGLEQTKTLPLSTFTFEQGNHYSYVIDIQATNIFVIGNPRVEDWNNVPYTQLPLILGPRDGKTLLLLDGYDKPYVHIDGKSYWLDRSGYNRHVELTQYYVDHNSSNHYYSFNGRVYNANQHGGIFSEIPVFQNISAEIVMEGDASVSNSNQPLVMAGAFVNSMEPRNFMAEMSYQSNGQISLYRGGVIAGNRLDINDVTLPHSEITKRHHWVFNSTPNQLQIYLDGDLRGEKMLNNIRVDAFKKNVIANGMTGKIFSIKVSNEQAALTDVVSNYRAARERYDIPVNETYFPTVKNGLEFCFDGRSGIETLAGKKIWRDQVAKNHAELVGSPSFTTNRFTFTSAMKPAMNLLYPVIIPNNFTAELIIKSHALNSGAPVYWATSNADTDLNKRMLFIHWPFEGNKIYVDSPGPDRYQFVYGSAVNQLHKVVIRRQFGGRSECWIDNKLAASGVAKTAITQICERMALGWEWPGDVYAIRLYTQVLTDEEMVQNWEYDKKAFGLTD